MCDCIKVINDKLKLVDGNMRLSQSILFTGGILQPSPVIIAVEVIKGPDKKHKPRLLATYCPFCGEKYPATKG